MTIMCIRSTVSLSCIHRQDRLCDGLRYGYLEFPCARLHSGGFIRPDSPTCYSRLPEIHWSTEKRYKIPSKFLNSPDYEGAVKLCPVLNCCLQGFCACILKKVEYLISTNIYDDEKYIICL